MKKIIVIGCGGSGKSTLSRKLGRVLGLPVCHLDRHYWNPGWVETGKEEWQRMHEESCQGSEWILDGNYVGTMDSRIKACDTVILLDMPTATCLWGLLKRVLSYWFLRTRRVDLSEGCPERLDREFIQWIWNFRKNVRPKVLGMIDEHRSDKQVIVLRSHREIESFLKDLSSG